MLLSPLWIVSGLAGAEITYLLRHRTPDDSAYSVALPTVTVTRSIDVRANPAAIWPLLRGIPHVRANEGRWNVRQDLIGVPRPLGAQLTGERVGADRYARWDHHIRFREGVTAIEPGRRLAWRFIFDDLDSWTTPTSTCCPTAATSA